MLRSEAGSLLRRVARVVEGGELAVSKAKDFGAAIFTACLMLLVFSLACPADTFTHRKSGEVLHGYATSQVKDNRTAVHTRQKGVVELNLAEWKVAADREGRNNKVIVLTLDDAIMFEIETAALEKAIVEVADEGPLFVLLEIDTPGGRIDFAQRICAAIAGARNCQVVGFVRGGRYGGAISAGAAVAFACDKIFMAGNTVIGAATAFALSQKGPQDFKEAYGEDIGEKFSSAWRAKLASLAEQNGRPGLLARAMIDKDIEVIEVSDGGNRLFIEPVNKKQAQNVVHTWSKKGSLLTLTAAEAVGCGIADKVVSSRRELVRNLVPRVLRLWRIIVCRRPGQN